MSPRNADALLFDLGNVLYGIDFNRAFACWAGYASCDAALLASRFKIDTAVKRHEVGEITDAEFFASLRRSLGVDLSDGQLLDGWNAIFLDEPPDISAAVATAAARVPIFAFSNTNAAHELHWSKKYATTLAHFSEVFVSHAIGLRKPDAAAFDFVVRKIGVPATRIVFFDDSVSNVEGARARGLQAVHVRSLADVPAAVAAALR
jgi:putative hydrolase of the HAD superfamily